MMRLHWSPVNQVLAGLSRLVKIYKFFYCTFGQHLHIFRTTSSLPFSVTLWMHQRISRNWPYVVVKRIVTGKVALAGRLHYLVQVCTGVVLKKYQMSFDNSQEPKKSKCYSVIILLFAPLNSLCTWTIYLELVGFQLTRKTMFSKMEQVCKV